LRWVSTPNGNRVTIRYDVSDFTHLNLTEEQLQKDVLNLADAVIDYSMPRDGITSVDSVSIERYCIFDFIEPDDINSFFVNAGFQHDSGMQSLGERLTVHRSAEGEYEVE
jgi:hypothetical protein